MKTLEEKGSYERIFIPTFSQFLNKLTLNGPQCNKLSGSIQLKNVWHTFILSNITVTCCLVINIFFKKSIEKKDATAVHKNGIIYIIELFEKSSVMLS